MARSSALESSSDTFLNSPGTSGGVPAEPRITKAYTHESTRVGGGLKTAVELEGLASNDRTIGHPVLTPGEKTSLLAEWHGQVTEVHENYFVAELRGKVGEGVRDTHEIAEIPFDEVTDNDMELLEEGAFFRLCISYAYTGQTRKRYTSVIFRRMPAYRRDELATADERAEEVIRGLRLV